MSERRSKDLYVHIKEYVSRVAARDETDAEKRNLGHALDNAPSRTKWRMCECYRAYLINY